MFKLLITLVTFLLLALAVMGMRHHTRELESQTAKLVAEIEIKKHKLWDQKPQITQVSNPQALTKNLQDHGMVGEVGVPDAPRTRPPSDDPGDLVAPVRRHQ